MAPVASVDEGARRNHGIPRVTILQGVPGPEETVEPFLLGAMARRGGRVELRVYAPNADWLGVSLAGTVAPLTRAGALYEGVVAARPGDEYTFVFEDGTELPDPCARAQPGGVRGPSGVIDSSHPWTDDAWEGLALDELVLYEIHVGAFTPEGTFDAVVPHLPALRELGVTAVELMPVATFPGERGWGYDGLYTYAPHPAYGGPGGLRRLVDAAHRVGLGVVLDVVYNHVGPGAEALRAFAPYFSDRHRTFWGDAINYDGNGAEAAREWAIQNACMWVRDYHADGLRLDAVHAIFDDGHPHVLAELAQRVRAVKPETLVISETDIDDRRPLERFGHDAQWADGFHHALHALLTGERDGYYAGYGQVADLAREFERTDAPRLVFCAQNHDQVGNRAFGDRLPADAMRVASACTLFAPGIPLLFMGEEYGERHPFQFFTDHIDPAIADATRKGRKREFASFERFAETELPDPQAVATFERSKLSRRELPGVRARYRELLQLRRELPADVETSVDEERRRLTVRRGPFELRADFERLTAEVSC
jgi:maltooligosyltrehalose trehalohydrolase